MFNRAGIAAVSLILLLQPAHAELRRHQVAIDINYKPATATVRTDARIVSGPDGARYIEAVLTNTSNREIELGRMTLRFPWHPAARVRLLCSGAWEQGLTEARVHLPGAERETQSYIMASHAGGYSHVGLVTWRRFSSRLSYDDGDIVMIADGEGRLVPPGDSLALETLRLAGNEDWQDALFAYADAIARENTIELKKPRSYVGWSTWDYYGRGWTFQNVTDNLGELLEIVPEANLVQLDGGWWQRRGDYLSSKAALNPGGMGELAKIIRAEGMTAGVHLDAMRAEVKAQIVQRHPEFFLKDQRGDLLTDAGPGKGNAFFDYSHPGARDYMRRVFANMRHNWGFEYIKVDFLRYGTHAYIASQINRGGGSRTIVPFDRHLTSIERLHLAMAAFREGMGTDAYFLACSAVFGPVFGHADGLRTGADVHPSFERFKSLALDNAGNFYLHGKVVYNDADYHVVRAKEDQDDTLTRSPIKDGKDMTLNEAEMWTHYIALFGGPKLNSDNLLTLRTPRRALFQLAASLPASERFVPIDLWQHARAGDDPPAVMLGEAAGLVRLAVFNWSDQSREFILSGLNEMELSHIARLGGTGETSMERGVMRITLAARHSMIFQVAHASFDRLRKTLSVAQ